jgi:hypothetical protein
VPAGEQRPSGDLVDHPVAATAIVVGEGHGTGVVDGSGHRLVDVDEHGLDRTEGAEPGEVEQIVRGLSALRAPARSRRRRQDLRTVTEGAPPAPALRAANIVGVL